MQGDQFSCVDSDLCDRLGQFLSMLMSLQPLLQAQEQVLDFGPGYSKPLRTSGSMGRPLISLCEHTVSEGRNKRRVWECYNDS